MIFVGAATEVETLRYALPLATEKATKLLAATSHAAEVSGLKQSLEWAEEELGRVKKQLEDKQGMR